MEGLLAWTETDRLDRRAIPGVVKNGYHLIDLSGLE